MDCIWHSAWALVLAALGLLATPSLAVKKYNITIGYLPCLTGEMRDRQGLTISGAISMAIDHINKDTAILQDVDILMEWKDTKCDMLTGTRHLVNMIRAGVVAFFGPEYYCHTAAIVAQSQNLPMISYKCSDYLTSPLSNFVRLESSGSQATKSVISLLRYYKWNKFSIIYEESWVSVALTLENHAKRNNMTVNHQMPVKSGFQCCEEKMTCCEPGFWYQFIQNTKNMTRIYVFLGSTSGLIEMMTAMESLRLFAKGEYMVIFLDMEAYRGKEDLKYLIKTEDRGNFEMKCPDTTPEFRERAQSLLVVVSSEPCNEYENFTQNVSEYDAKPPFNIIRPFANSKFHMFISIYAAYLYDSLILYATALDHIIREETHNETLTHKKLIDIAKNGSRIVAEMIKSTPFKSVSGMSIRLDERANSEGNFSVLAFKSANLTKALVNCNYGMVSVGTFHQNFKEYPEYKLNARYPIDWPDGVKPEDEPACGFLNEKCPRDDSHITSLIVAGTLGVTLFCALVVTISIYR